MADSDAGTCLQCGARLPEGAELCDLCGAPVGEAADAVPGKGPAVGAYCNACGRKNPPGANFCSQCGARLQPEGAGDEGVAAHPSGPSAGVQRAASPQRPERPAQKQPAERRPGRRVLAVVGVAVLVIALLFVLTTWSKQQPAGEETRSVETNETAPSGASGDVEAVVEQLEAAPLPPALADSVGVLQERIAGQEGTAQQTARRALVALYLRAGQSGHAALVQKRLAEGAGTALAWQRAGNLFLTWMNRLESSQKPRVAPFAAAAYERVLAQQPGNLDAKTNLAWAVQFAPGRNPMQAIQLTNAVLEADPDHLQANFNKGRFFMKINRLDEALAQFEKVRRLAGEDTHFYEIAGRYIVVAEELKAREGGDGAGGATRTS